MEKDFKYVEDNKKNNRFKNMYFNIISHKNGRNKCSALNAFKFNSQITLKTNLNIKNVKRFKRYKSCDNKNNSDNDSFYIPSVYNSTKKK